MSTNAFNNRNTHYNDNCQTFVAVKLLSKSVIGLKIFGIDLFLGTLNLSIPLSFIHPKIRIINLDEHTFLGMCGLFAGKGVKPFSQIDI